MWFLLTQIFFPLLLAALFGAWLAWWWFKRRYEDVTDTYSTLSSRGTASVDLSPIEQRLAGLETNLAAPSADFDGINSKLSLLSSAVTENRQANVDLTPVEARLSSLEDMVRGIEMPDVDLGPLHSGLAQMDLSLSSLDTGKSEIEALKARIDEMQSSINTLFIPDLDPVTERLTGIEAAVSGYESPDLDLAPLHDRFDKVESLIQAPNEDIVDLKSQFAGFSGYEAPEFDFDPVYDRISSLEGRFDAPDYNMLEMRNRLAGIETTLRDLRTQDTNVEPMSVDFEPIEKHLEAIETRLGQPDYNMIELRDRMAAVEARIADMNFEMPAIEMPDIHIPEPQSLAPIEQRLDMLYGHMTTPNQDIEGLHARLAGLEASVAMLDKPPLDLGPMYQRLGALEQTFGAMRSEMMATQGRDDLAPHMETIERQILGLQNAIMSIRQPDLSPVINSMHTMESRMDMSGLESRMTAIEYGLAAVHHTMRSRDHVQEPAPRPAPQPVYQPPVYETKAYDPPAYVNPVPVQTPPPPPPAAPPVTSRPVDPVTAARRPGDKANLLVSPAFGPSDDLKRISGVGPMLSDLLNETGVYYFWQVAEWSPMDVEYVDEKLAHFKGRIERDNWVGQARDFAAEPGTANRPS